MYGLLLPKLYPVLKAITGVVVDKTLVEYDLIIFESSALWRPAEIGFIPAAAGPSNAWQPNSGVNAFFQSIDWAADGQTPYLAFISHASEVAPEALKVLVDRLLDNPGKPPLILVSSATAEIPSTGHPDPGLLVKAIKACGVSPSRTLYVGDIKDSLSDAKPVLLDYCHPHDLFRNPAKLYLPSVTSEFAAEASHLFQR